MLGAIFLKCSISLLNNRNMLKHLFIYVGNVLKELSEPAGAVIYTSMFKVR